MRRSGPTVIPLLLLTVLLAAPLCAGQAPVPVGPGPAPAGAKPNTYTFRRVNGKDVVGEIVAEDRTTVVIFNGAGNLALKVKDIRRRTPGGDLEAASGQKGGLVTQVAARQSAAPLHAIAPPGAQPIAGAVSAQGPATLATVVAEPEKYIANLRRLIDRAGPGPTLIEIEAQYRVRPVNKAEAYAVLGALEKKSGEWLASIPQLSEKELREELTASPYTNEETFGQGKIDRLCVADMRVLVALKRLVHAINKESWYTYAVNTSFTDLLNPRRPMGDCNASCALIYHLAWKAGYQRDIQLFEDTAGHHAVLAMTCINDSRHYFAETTGGFLSGNPAYQKLAEDPATMQKTVIASLLSEGFPPGLSALDNLRLATILRVTSLDKISANNFKHYFVAYLNNRLDAHDDAAVQQWAAVYDQIEGVGSFAKLPRTVIYRRAN